MLVKGHAAKYETDVEIILFIHFNKLYMLKVEIVLLLKF